MALSSRHLCFASKRASGASAYRIRGLSTSSRLQSSLKGQILGEFKGFDKPSWSAKAKFLDEATAKLSSRVSVSDVKRVANLSYLYVEDSKLDALTRDMDNILKSMASMEEIDTKNVQPLLSILEEYQLKTREDVARATTFNSEDGPVARGSSAVEGHGGESKEESAPAVEEEWGYVEIPDPKILDHATQKEMGFFVVPKQKQPWEEEETPDLEAEDVAALRAVQRALADSKKSSL